MWRTIHSLLVVFCAFCPAAALAGSIVGADGVLRYPYGERTPPTLICAPLFVCDLALESGETIVNVAVGDSVRWLISPASSGATNATTAHLLIKPVDVGLRTNLFVTTNRRAYELLLISRKDDPVLRVGFTYPQSVRQTFEAVRLQGERARALAASQHDATEKLDFDYRVEGDRRLQPVRVYNDGVHTYVQMPTALRELPVVFAVEAGGNVLVNQRFNGHTFIVDGVPECLVLMDGSGKHQRRVLITHRGGAR